MKTEQENRSVLITGTSTGLGRATARLLDKTGFRVFAGVRRMQDGDVLRKSASGKLTPVLLDVNDEAAITRVKDEITEAVGGNGLWGLVNNAGISFRAPLEFVPLSEFRKLFDSNLFGLLAITQAFLPLLRQAQGRIINISSLTSMMYSPFHGTYSCAKMAVNGLTNTLRLEVKPFGVQVALMIYGGIQTELWDRIDRQTTEIAEHYPPEFMELYAARQKKALEYFSSRGRKGLLPETAAQPIIHALTVKHPRRTYFAGSDAKFYNLLDKVLYGRLRDRVVLKTIGLESRSG